jgi:NitT/TauT family transport system ATP-binding protein
MTMLTASPEAGIGTRSMIELDEVTLAYRTDDGPVTALQETSFTIPEQQFVSILGPSGCGKSTLMMLVAGLLRPTSGSVRLRGAEVDGPTTEAGVVFQSDVLLPWRSVLDNVLLQAEIRGERKATATARARELLQMVGLEEFEHRLPRELSGGMRQRCSIARALLHEPSLLLMDEPFGALDAMTRDQMNLDLLRLWQSDRKTVIFITHSIDEAVFLSDRVLVMSPRPGSVAADIAIDLPRPRRLAVRDSPMFVQYAKQIRGLFEGMGLLREES